MMVAVTIVSWLIAVLYAAIVLSAPVMAVVYVIGG